MYVVVTNIKKHKDMDFRSALIITYANISRRESTGNLLNGNCQENVYNG
jgi:hypothetical protein